jgi:hypothetical protein
MVKFCCSVLVGLGFFILIGTAGSDCDGACMERSMTLGEIAIWSFIGLSMMGLGAIGLYRASE